jgi:two-component system response regulator AlgR
MSRSAGLYQAFLCAEHPKEKLEAAASHKTTQTNTLSLLLPGKEECIKCFHNNNISHLSVNEKGRIVLIPVEDVLYLKAELKYVTVRTSAREYLIEDSLVRLEEELGERFTRIHRNCLVANSRIREIGKLPGDDDGHFLRLDGLDERLAVSRRQYSTLREKFKS